MVNQGYAASAEPGRQNVCDREHYLSINITGCLVTADPFTTHIQTGRRDYTLIYLTKGKMDILTAMGKQSITAGEMIVYQPDREYWYSHPQGEEIVYYWAHFTGYGVEEMMKECAVPFQKVTAVGLLEPVMERFAELFRRFLTRQPCWEMEAAADLQTIFALLGRGARGGRVHRESSRLARSLEYLHDHYREDIDEEHLAALEHLSVSRYRCLFKSVTGLPLHGYLTDLRLRHACVLLGQTGLSVRQVAAAVGYADGHYFSRLFRKRFGVPPKSLRG